MTDPYKVLGVPPGASEQELKKAYRSLCKRYHPDVNPGDPAAEERFKQVQLAYAAITRPGAAADDGPVRYARPSQRAGQAPFADFDFAAFDFGTFVFRRAHAARRDSYRSREAAEDPGLRAVQSYLNAGCYAEALQLLENLPAHTAQWHYYSALAYAGLGRDADAWEHASTAASLKPGSLEYQRLLQLLQNRRGAYATARPAKRGGWNPLFSIGKILLFYLLAQLLFRLLFFWF